MLMPWTKTEIAKYAVNQLVAGKATAVIEGQLEERTQLDTDDYKVHIPCICVGQLIASRLRPFTDHFVDSAIFNYQIWRASRTGKAMPEVK